MNTTNGKIAAQSRQKMVQALLTLMDQYDYREITVTQITQEAQLSRKTFYRLFSEKDEILALFFEGLFQECFAQIKALKLQHYWDVVQLFFDFWEERKDLLFLLQKNNLLLSILYASLRICPIKGDGGFPFASPSLYVSVQRRRYAQYAAEMGGKGHGHPVSRADFKAEIRIYVC